MGSETVSAVASLWRADWPLLDCSLVCEDGRVGASRAVLASHSSLLAQVLQESDHLLLPGWGCGGVSRLVALLHGVLPTQERQEEEVANLALALGLGEEVLQVGLSSSCPVLILSCPYPPVLPSSCPNPVFPSSSCLPALLLSSSPPPPRQLVSPGRSLEEDLRYIFGESLAEAEAGQEEEKLEKQSEGESGAQVQDDMNPPEKRGTKRVHLEDESGARRRSKRSTQGRHWKFGGAERRAGGGAGKREEAESDSESVMSDLTSTLEAFDSEVVESEQKVKLEKKSGKCETNKSVELKEGEMEVEHQQVRHGKVEVTTSPSELDLQARITSISSKLPPVLKSSSRSARAGKELGEMEGDYHLRGYYTYLAREEVDRILPSYYTHQGDSFTCKVPSPDLPCLLHYPTLPPDQVCEEQNTSRESVNQHLLSHHLKLLLHKCEVCGLKVRTEEEYQAHILGEHGAASIQRLQLEEGQQQEGVVILQVNHTQLSSRLKCAGGDSCSCRRLHCGGEDHHHHHKPGVRHPSD